jgi:hypothetical protein
LLEQAGSHDWTWSAPGQLRQVTKLILDGAVEGGITDDLGSDKLDPAGKDSGNPPSGS